MLDAKILRRLVRVYLTGKPPKTAADFNYQAELKAVSHWRWLKDGAEAELVPGPHKDQRLKEAAKFVLKKWEKELKDRQTKDQQPPSKKGKFNTVYEDESRSDDDIISGIYRIKHLSKPLEDSASIKLLSDLLLVVRRTHRQDKTRFYEYMTIHISNATLSSGIPLNISQVPCNKWGIP